LLLLISTPRFLLSYDTDERRAKVLHDGMGEYYGITWDRSGRKLALSHSLLANDTLTDLASYAVSEVGVITIGNESTPPFLSAPHQILWVGDDHVVATNTGRNTVASVRVSDHSVIQRRIGVAAWDRLSADSHDGVHLNSLFYNDGTLYVVAHNFEKGSFVSELVWPTLIERTRRPLPGLTGVHNLIVQPDGRWIVCDSLNGSVCDGLTGEVLWANGRQGFARGLGATTDMFFVGHSEMSGRSLRTATESGIWVIERETWRTLDYIYLGHFGCVHEIRIADHADLAHTGTPLHPDALDTLDNRGERISQDRQDRVRRWANLRRHWVAILGDLLTSPDSAMVGANDLRLSKFQSDVKGAVGIAATIRLRPELATNAHGSASLVARYRGPEDQNMVAALFQWGRGHISAALWVNENGRWTQVVSRMLEPDQLTMHDGRQSFRAQLIEKNGKIILVIGDELFLSLADQETPLPARGGDFGIRMLGSGFEFVDVQSVNGDSTPAVGDAAPK
jgi:hypothetical protein